MTTESHTATTAEPVDDNGNTGKETAVNDRATEDYRCEQFATTWT